MNSYKLGTFERVSNDFREDSTFQFEDFLINKIAKSFATAETKSFIHGDGRLAPVGLLNFTNESKVGHTTQLLNYDDLIKLYASLESKFRKNATWIMSDKTFIKLKELKDNNGNYIWKEEKLLGKPVVIVDEMNNATYPIAFGDFSYLWILEREQPTIKVITELLTYQNETGYFAYHSLSTLLTNNNAIKLLEVKE